MTGTREPIGVIGTGYVGLVTAAGFAELGNEVWCIDIDEAKIAGLERGEIPIWEPGLEDLVVKHRGRLHFSTNLQDALEHARLLFVAVGTPPTYSGDADLSAVFSVVDAMPPSDRHALVMKSTVPVGTGASIKRRFAATGKEGFRYVSCPEFLKEGSAVKDFLEPDRVVVGDDGDWAGDAVVELYAPLGAPIVRTDIRSAEMVKLASNAFLATKISFINEIANVCEETGADVAEVAKGMGLDDRIGPKFLQAGIGFGGSCFAGEETVLARLRGRTTLLTFEQLWARCEGVDGDGSLEVLEPEDLEVLAWEPGEDAPSWQHVMQLTRRHHAGELVEVETKMGRRLRTTPDHPFLVGDGEGPLTEVVFAEDLTTDDWLPVAQGAPAFRDRALVSAVDVDVDPARVRVRPRAEELAKLTTGSLTSPQRLHDVKRSGTLRMDEAVLNEVSLTGATLSTTKNGQYVSQALTLDAAFWRVVGLYIAEGHAGDERLNWSFHPEREQHLVDEVVSYWLRHGVEARVEQAPTARCVRVHSRLVSAWWRQQLGMGRTSYEQRLPDWIWERPDEDRWALLSGLWEGDGSWSLVNGGPSVILEFGTVSDELADGVLRLLGSLGIVASQRVGRTAKSTKDTFWIRIAGAEQVERCLALVPERDRVGVLASIARQQKRIAPTGYRRFGDGPAFVRVKGTRRVPGARDVFSLEVLPSHTVVTSGGCIVNQCFPKDVSALKQLAGNSGYHFQLLSAVIEVNELQKRRVIGKLQRHLGALVGKRIALLGLAFKPNTDDMREASSLVLAARLQAEGAHVSAYDPVAEEEAKRLMPGVEFAASPEDCVRGADAVVLVTEWPEFRDLDWNAVASVMAGDFVVDGRNTLDPDVVRASGLRYEGVGRGGEADDEQPVAQGVASTGSGPG
jgi:UDP-glucose 6-dehydrogenase